MKELIELAKLLKEVSALFSAISDEELSTQEVNWQQVLILEQVRQERKTMGEISKVVGLSYSTISGLVHRLEKKQLVIRSRDLNDKRIVWVSPSQRLGELGSANKSNLDEESLQPQMADMISSLHMLLDKYAEKKRATS
ncbi:MarR family transcriptional regulator [Brevibacillus sp. SYSU BS000544]|uniref:MarR family transcriptional regulator n=1 Tax=Brevibacillus sp. SYSU BS000544 TaxID=3416443 RepID=UPI003CE513FE